MKKNLDPKQLTVAEQIVLAMIQIYWMQNESDMGLISIHIIDCY